MVIVNILSSSEAKNPLNIGPLRLWHVFMGLLLTTPILLLISTIGSGNLFWGTILQSSCYGLAVMFWLGSLTILTKKHYFSSLQLGTQGNSVRTIGIGVLGGLAIIILVYAYENLVGLPHTDTAGLIKTMQLGENYWMGISFIIATCAVAPVGEELLFRGLLFKGLRDGLVNFSDQFLLKRLKKLHSSSKQWSMPVALFVSTLLFAAIHQTENTPFTILFAYSFMAVGTAAVYVLTGSLTAAITAHAVNNIYVLIHGLLLVTTVAVPAEFKLLPAFVGGIGVGLTLLVTNYFEKSTIPRS